MPKRLWGEGGGGGTEVRRDGQRIHTAHMSLVWISHPSIGYCGYGGVLWGAWLSGYGPVMWRDRQEIYTLHSIPTCMDFRCCSAFLVYHGRDLYRSSWLILMVHAYFWGQCTGIIMS